MSSPPTPDLAAAPGGELLPCPFCGSGVKLDERMDESLHSHAIVPFYSITCPECDVRGQSWEDRDEVIAHWNTRWNTRATPAAETAPDVRIADLDAKWRAAVEELQIERGEVSRLKGLLGAQPTPPDVGLVEALRELSEAAYDGEWEFARREGDEQAPAAIFVRGYNAPIAIAISPRLGVEQFERDARFIIAAVRFARAALSRAGEPKPTAPDAGLVEALRKLVANYDHFCTTSGNQADAYYSLVKSHHGDWEAARAALARAGERP